MKAEGDGNEETHHNFNNSTACSILHTVRLYTRPRYWGGDTEPSYSAQEVAETIPEGELARYGLLPKLELPENVSVEHEEFYSNAGSFKSGCQ